MHIGDGGADGFRTVAKDAELDRGGQRGAQAREQGFHPVHGLNDVRAGLALDVHKHGGFATHPAGGADIFHVVHGCPEVADADGGTVFVGDDDVLIVIGGKDLVVGVDGIGLAGTVETTFGGVNAALNDGGADIFEAQTERGDGTGIDLHAYGGFLTTFDGDEANTGHFA